MGIWKEREGRITKELKEAFEIKRNVNFLNCGHGFIAVYICQYLPNYKLKLKYVISNLR